MSALSNNWKIDYGQTFKNYANTGVWMQLEDNEGIVGKVFGKTEELANKRANLIVAAPAMYEAIQYAITALAATDSSGMIDTGELIADADKARKRLIKAIKSLQ